MSITDVRGRTFPMKHETIDHPAQTALREKHRELLIDIEAIAARANAARRNPRPSADDIIRAAEVALVRVTAEWRRSRGGAQNNQFFSPLSKRLRRIIAFYKESIRKAETAQETGGRWIYQIVNYEEIPFHRLRPYFRASAVDDAIKMAIRLGLRELPGVRIYEDLSNDV
jgi:hypothetical protein